MDALWIPDYLGDIEADFLAIYHHTSWDEFDGPKFIRLCNRLPLYDGALRRRLEIQMREEEETGKRPMSKHEYPDKMSMKEALARSRGDDESHMATLNAINEDNKRSSFGALFEYSTA